MCTENFAAEDVVLQTLQKKRCDRDMYTIKTLACMGCLIHVYHEAIPWNFRHNALACNLNTRQRKKRGIQDVFCHTRYQENLTSLKTRTVRDIPSISVETCAHHILVGAVCSRALEIMSSRPMAHMSYSGPCFIRSPLASENSGLLQQVMPSSTAFLPANPVLTARKNNFNIQRSDAGHSFFHCTPLRCVASDPSASHGNGLHKAKKRVAVIGAGWAGLGAAYHLSKQEGLDVVLIDAAKSVGGLVAGWKTDKGREVEVGIHGMWRPYFNLFHLVKKELGLNPFTDWTRSSQRSPKGKVVESPIFNDLPRLPTPLGTFVYTKFLDLPLIDRLSALPLLEAVVRWDNSDETWRKFDKMTARELFKHYGCSERVYKEAFEPMLLVGLFAPGEQCSAAGALGMLYFFILAHQADFDVVWPRGTVGSMIFAPLVQRIREQGGEIRTSTRLKDVSTENDRVVEILTAGPDGSEETTSVDAVVFSVGISGLQGILRSSKTLSAREEFRNTNNLSSIDVMAVRLYFDRKIRVEFASNACFGFDSSTGWTYFDLNALHDEFQDFETTVIEADFYHSNQFMPMNDREVAEEVRRRLCTAEVSFKGAKVEDFVVVRVPRGVTRKFGKMPPDLRGSFLLCSVY